jgi:predicted DNA-binding transcriptional regulator YafY
MPKHFNNLDATASRQRTVKRVLMLLEDLRGGARGRMSEFAQRRGVCVRTIRRDFATLESVGFAICRSPESGDGEYATWWMEKA